MQIKKDLWERVANDDQQAYAEVYRFYFRGFYNYGKKFTNDEVLLEDAIQEALLIIWDKRHTLTSIEFPGTYFYTSFRYTLLQKLKQQRRLVTTDKQEEEPEFNAEHIIINREMEADVKHQLEKAMIALTPRQREAIFLRFYEDLSYEEVANVLQITTKATYKIMARALSQLRKNMPSCLPFLLWIAKAMITT